MMKKFMAACAVLLLPGCIEFEKQTLVFLHYPETDTLVIWQHYGGIHGEDQENGLSEKEREQLHSVITGQRTFFFDNWIATYDAAHTTKFIKEKEAKLKQAGLPEGEAGNLRPLLALARLVKKSVTIKNGPFFLNNNNHLSATQQVTIRNVGNIIREANAAIRASILHGDSPFGGFDEGDPNIELLEKSAHAKMEYLTLKGQQLRYRLPMTRENFRKLDRNDVKPFLDAGVTIEHKNNLLIITAGKVKAKETAVSISIPEVAYQPNATQAVRERYGLAKDFDPAKARATFLKASDAQFLKK